MPAILPSLQLCTKDFPDLKGGGQYSSCLSTDGSILVMSEVYVHVHGPEHYGQTNLYIVHACAACYLLGNGDTADDQMREEKFVQSCTHSQWGHTWARHVYYAYMGLTCVLCLHGPDMCIMPAWGLTCAMPAWAWALQMVVIVAWVAVKTCNLGTYFKSGNEIVTIFYLACTKTSTCKQVKVHNGRAWAQAYGLGFRLFWCLS